MMANCLPLLIPLLAGFCIAPSRAQPILDSGLGGSPIAVDRTAAPAIYAGRFRSLDGGATWSAYYLTDPGKPQPPLYALVVDPGQPATVYYATATEQGGIWKSSDRGATWARANSGLPASGGAIEDFFASLAAPYALYARVGGTVYRSTDRATTWTRQSTLPVSAGLFRIAPRDPSMQFCTQRGVVWRSADEGASWEVAGTIPLGPEGEVMLNSVMDLAPDGASADILYAAERGGWSFRGGQSYWAGIWKSLDRGSAWGFLKGGGPRWIVTDPAGGPNVFASSSETPAIQKSDNRGASWKTISLFQETVLGGTRLAISDTAPCNVYAATPRGVYLSTDEGETWRPLHGSARVTLAVPAQGLQLRAETGTESTHTLRVEVLERACWKVPFTAAVEGGAWLQVSPVAGSVLTVYLAGIGAVDNPVATGAAAPEEPLARPAAPASAMIGDQPVQIAAICLTPGFVGLAQASLLTPELAAGDDPGVITVGESSSNAATVSVGAP